VIVVEAPGLGDDIQAIKAGILEIADILVVNKADRPGAENTLRALSTMLAMAQGNGSLPLAGKHMRRHKSASEEAPELVTKWQPPVQALVATEGTGISELVEAVKAHRNHLRQSGLWQVKEAQRLEKDLQALIRDRLMTNWQESIPAEQYARVLDDLTKHKLSPMEALQLLT
jgi:LAO/AO transport system kinase